MSTLKPGIVHLGLGAFFRAHGATYIQEALDKNGGNWGVVGVSLRSAGVRDKLEENAWKYHLVQLSDTGLETQKIDVLTNVLVAPENPDAVLRAMASPHTKIVSLTVTEKGYCLSSSNGSLDFNHPDVQHDINNKVPVSAPGYIVRAMEIRKARGLSPFTVLSLDNLLNNGAQIKAAVLALAEKINPELAMWIKEYARFPATMVDRVVPATTQALIENVADRTGISDPALVGHEPFRQWVIEDDFVNNDRPEFDGVGAQLVSNVAEFEHMKLRMLNGTHSSLAYLGAIAGFRTVADACADETIASFLQQLWKDEIIPSLSPPEATDLNDYANDLLKRYKNTGIQHRLEQIAMDGSHKLPQRILATIEDNARAGRESPGLTLAIAGWIRFLEGTDDNGDKLEVSDPLKDRLQTLIKTHTSRAELVKGLLELDAVFGGSPPDHFETSLIAALNKLDDIGAKAAMQEMIS